MLKPTIASAFRSKGKKKMDRKELTYTLSFDLKYFSHETSKKVVDLAEKKGLLSEEDGLLTPSFSFEDIDVPPGFKPDVNRIFRSEDVFERLLDEISLKLGKERADVIREINTRQMELGNILDGEVVAILYALENGIDVRNYIGEVEEEIFKK
ncbi:DUF2240 family protein [Geoglobus acetivorans]|uniref:DUF2240 family protein n=1 Tax=Geoglobus acetivorans TaxID=565033 RepID=A0A0A7GCJ4_GEOAI|nr:hypothetical protein GACE_0678 [Geoglobus acetivorans]